MESWSKEANGRRTPRDRSQSTTFDNTSKTWACCQRRVENSGANGDKICIIVTGRMHTSITSL
jgi:hypothetical protein